MTALPDPTGEKQAESTRFKPGQSGNPAGRPKGSRNRMSEQFLADFAVVWEEQGIEALRKLATDDPAAFVRAAVSLIPKRFEHSGPDLGPIRTESEVITDIEAARWIGRFLAKVEDAAPS